MKLLCDAVVVIDAYKINKWQYLTSAHHIFLGSIVAHKECIFYIDNYQKQTIDFALDEKNGKVRILTATVKEISKVAKKVSKYKLIIDPGETESIALMLNPVYNDLIFCTADKAAVKAAYLCGLTNRVVSLEYCFGRSTKLNLPNKCTEKVMRHLKADAIQYFGTIEVSTEISHRCSQQL